MKTKFNLIIFILMGSCLISNAQTNVSGFISTNTNWNLTGSPYIVSGNVLVMTNATLTIDPGVIVKFDSAKTIQIDGALIAIGIPLNRITFTSNKPFPSAGDWGRIQFSDSGVDANYDVNGNYLSGSILKYCDILYGGKIVGTGTAALEMFYSSPYISNCNIISSGGSGMLCAGNSIKIDSSSIKYSTGYGIYFGPFQANAGPCILTIQDDTISYNNNGGIGFNNAGSPCNQVPIRILINRNYFNGNTQHGALFTENGFLDKLVVSENVFENNTGSQSQSAGGAYLATQGGPIIECNQFINNQGTNFAALYIKEGGYNSGFVRNNIFENNRCTATSSYNCIIWHENFNLNYEEFFTNNTIRNNTNNGGVICRFYGFSLQPPQTTFHIDSNNFINNHATSSIYLNTQISNSTDQFATLSFNNFLNSNVQYEIYNDCPYGGLNISANNNYWSSQSTQHVDSVIYDFFDDASKSVVFYSPILTSTISIDTICMNVLNGFSNIEIIHINIQLYPNPASKSFFISFDKQIQEGSAEMINMFGGIVFHEKFYQTNKKEINIQGVTNGVYLLKVFDGLSYCCKKIIVENY